MARILAAVLAGGAAGCASRGKIRGRGVHAGGGFLLQAGYMAGLDAVGASHQGEVGIRTRGLVGRRAGACVGFDTRVGGGDGGFGYDLTLYPIGIGLRAGSFMVAACGGAGVNGIQPAVPVALRLPAEVSIAAGSKLRVVAWARGAPVFGAGERNDGARSVGFIDELEAGAGLRVGKGARYGWARASNGYYVGGSYRELLGGRFVGVVIGYGVSGRR